MLGKQTPVDITPFKHLYPFESNYTDIRGFNYHYLDMGEGDPVLMLHGNPTWSFYYRNLAQALSSGYRVIVPDHMGCGLSDKPDPEQYDYILKNRIEDLETLLDRLNIKDRITLILHDWGGMIGLSYALRHLDRIKRLVITNTTGFFTPGGKGLPFRLWLVRHITPFATVGVLGFNLFSVASLYMASRKGLSQDVKKGLTAPYNSWRNRIATLKFVQDIPVYPNHPSYQLGTYMQENLYKISHIPKLICWGKHDPVFTMPFYEEWQRRFPNAEFHLFKDAGHYLLEDVPEKVIPLVEDFLVRNPID